MFEHPVVQIRQCVQRPLSVEVEPAPDLRFVGEAVFQLGLYSIMRKFPLIPALILSSSLSFGQAGSNSITVTASRGNPSGPPDQAVFSVHVDSGVDTSLDDVIAALQGTGISAANLQNLNTLFNSRVSESGVTQTATLDWWFTFTAPLTKNKDTITMLTNLQATIAKKNNGMTMSFSIQGTQASAQPQTCLLPDLLADARSQAQKLADGAGVSVGNILAMSSSTTGVSTAGIAGVLLGASSSPCTLTVKFALSR